MLSPAPPSLSTLPPDVVYYIILTFLVHPEVIARLRCVCKAWHTLLSAHRIVAWGGAYAARTVPMYKVPSADERVLATTFACIGPRTRVLTADKYMGMTIANQTALERATGVIELHVAHAEEFAQMFHGWRTVRNLTMSVSDGRMCADLARALRSATSLTHVSINVRRNDFCAHILDALSHGSGASITHLTLWGAHMEDGEWERALTANEFPCIAQLCLRECTLPAPGVLDRVLSTHASLCELVIRCFVRGGAPPSLEVLARSCPKLRVLSLNIEPNSGWSHATWSRGFESLHLARHLESLHIHIAPHTDVWDGVIRMLARSCSALRDLCLSQTLSPDDVFTHVDELYLNNPGLQSTRLLFHHTAQARFLRHAGSHPSVALRFEPVYLVLGYAGGMALFVSRT